MAKEQVICAVLLALFALLVPATVSGQPTLSESERKEVGKLLLDAKQAFDAQQYELAISQLEKAYASYPDSNILFRIGQCHERLGDVSLALGYYRRYLEQTPNAPDKETVRARISNLEATLEPEQPTVGIAKLETSPPGATVRIDGATHVTPVTVELSVGSHDAQFELDGYEPTQRTIEVDGESINRISVSLLPAAPEVARSNVVPWVFAGLGIASAGVSVAAFVVSSNAASDVSAWDDERNAAYANNTPVPARPDGYDDAVEREAVARNIGFAAGASALLFAGTALVIYLVSGSETESLSASAGGLSVAF